MKVLVINAGSSSLKYQLIDMSNEAVIAKGLCERIGIDGQITHKTGDGRQLSYAVAFPTHKEAFQELTKILISGEGAVLKDLSEISAIGHRVVQGGEKVSKSVRITPEVLDVFREMADLAPLHNPAIVTAIEACQAVFDKSVPQVAVCDTAFHQTMPEKAYIYPIPYEYYEKYHIRRYGFHGTSHRFVSGRLAEILQKPLESLKVITVHLGNGSSITAIDKGRSVDTTMGFTPLAGIIMGTRSGDIDPSIVSFLAEREGISASDVVNILNKKSGYIGVSGLTSDHRDLVKAANEGNKRAKLACELQRYEIKKFIGAYAAAMGGVDAVIFTGGIGENDPQVRADACADLGFMGIEIDPSRNKGSSEQRITTDSSKVQVWVIPTNEELLIARDTRDIVQ